MMGDAFFLLPELILVLTLCGIVVSEWTYYGERLRLVSGIAWAGILLAGIQALWVFPHEPKLIFNNHLSLDGLTLFFKMFFLALAAFVIVVAHRSDEIAASRRAEFVGMVVAATLALSFVCSSTDLLLMYLSIQFIQFLAYFMTGYSKQSVASAEAAMKFLIFSMVASLFFLFSVAILFSAAKTVNLVDLQKVLTTQALSPEMGLIIFGLLFLSLLFFLGAFPMHLWLADVLHGSPTPSSLFVCLAIPGLGFAIAFRFLSAIRGQPGLLESVHWKEMVGFVASVTMLFGALMALKQTRVRRLLAFLVMSRMGFLLLGLMTPSERTLASLLINLLTDLFALSGVYLIISRFIDLMDSDEIDDWKRIPNQARFEKIVLLVFLGSFMGFPPFPGFLSRFFLMSAVVEQHGYYWIVLWLFSSVAGLIACARVANAMVVTDGSSRAPRGMGALRVAEKLFLVALFVPLLWCSLFSEKVILWARSSVAPILW